MAQRVGRTRFSLLLLDEGEDVLADYLAFCDPPANRLPSAGGASLRGRLRLCSLSLVFDADERGVPVVRLPLVQAEALEAVGPASSPASALRLLARAWVLQTPGAPYAHERCGRGGAEEWRFTLAYAPLAQLLGPATLQAAVSKLPHWDRLAQLRECAAAREAAAPFDFSRVADPHAERPLYGCPCAQVTLLLREAGALAVTASRAYFQPLGGNLGADTPHRSAPLSGLAALARRRHGGAPTALELFFSPAATAAGGGGGGGAPGGCAGGWESAPSALLVFRSRHERDAALAALLAAQQTQQTQQQQQQQQRPAGRPALAAASALVDSPPAALLARVAALWSRGALSNASYLLYLNLAAGRTFADAGLWPVFPWVLADYSSPPPLDLNADADAAAPHRPPHPAQPAARAPLWRDLARPVGALNAARLASCRERSRQLAAAGEAPFLWGTHYSTPGYTLFWLLRARPQQALRLQGGRYDAPDRLFASVGAAWGGVTGPGADVKELTPEFYGCDPSWLTNALGLPLGTRSNGTPVGDVVLPPWAASPAHFLAVQRSALEAPAVSTSLHRWIDLVFGCAQRGAAAVAADNTFHPLTYANAAADGGDGDDDGGGALPQPPLSADEAAARSDQVREFGSCPAQLFAAPHPARAACPAAAWPRPGGPPPARADATDVAGLLAALTAMLAAEEEGGAREAQAAAGGVAGPPAQQQHRAPQPHPPPPANPPRPAAAAPQPPRPAADRGWSGGDGGGFGGGGASPPRAFPHHAAALPLWSRPRLGALAAPAAVPAHRRAGRGGAAAVGGLALAPSRALTCGADGMLRAWRLGRGGGGAGGAVGCELECAARLGRAPLMCCALVGGGFSADGGGGGDDDATAWAGAADGCVAGLRPASGARLGGFGLGGGGGGGWAGWAAHDGPVAACAALHPPGGGGGGDARLATAGADGALRVWCLARSGCGAGAGCAAEATLCAPDGAPLTALAAGADGPGGGAPWSLFAGGRDGSVARWDLRSPSPSPCRPSRPAGAGGGGSPAWLVVAAAGPVAGLAACPDGVSLLVAAPEGGGGGGSGGGGGALRLLDLRLGGAGGAVAALHLTAASGGGGAPRCCALAGATAVAGLAGGRLVAWDPPQPAPAQGGAGRAQHAGGGGGGRPACAAQPGAGGGAGVCAVAALGEGRDARLATLDDDGLLRLYAGAV